MPTTAIPTAPPTCCAVASTPPAAAACCGVTPASTMPGIGTSANPIPAPATIIPGSRASTEPLPPSSCAVIASSRYPAACSTAPTATTCRPRRAAAPRRQRRGEQVGPAQREEQQARPQGRQAASLLQIQRQEQEERSHGHL